jgi:hypothetical protein
VLEKIVCPLWCHNRSFVRKKKVLILDGAVKTPFFSEKLLYLSPKKNPSFLAALTSLRERKGVDK